MRITPNRLRIRAGLALLLAGLLAAPVPAKQRIDQLVEDSAISKTLVVAQDALAAPLAQICEPGAQWLRLSFKDLVLAPYDSLTLVSSAGERYTFQGEQWNNRAFSTRALRGNCIDIHASFGSADSRYAVDGYQYGTQALSATSVVVAGAGDICDSSGSACSGTSDLIVNINPTAVFTAGDNAYESGTLSEYNSRYAPTWGRFKTLTNPTPGNHDYNTSNASGYFDYFNGTGAQTGPAGDRSKGYYSWNVGDWHFIALNTMSGGTLATAQLTWLQADLDANTKPCTAAYWHHPLVSRGNYTGYTQVKPFWDKLYAAHADLVLVGHDHNYQRYGLMNPSQVADANGIRQVLVGTGGRAFYGLSGSHALLQASNDNSHGVLKLTLTATGYTGEFVHSTGSFTDTFSGSCHKAALPNTPPVANFGSVTNGLSATFTDSSTDSDGTIVSRSWTFGDGGTSTSTNPSHTYAAAGPYNVALAVTDNGGASNTVTKAITVVAPGNNPPLAKFSVATNGLVASFTDSSTDSDGTIATRNWNFGDSGTATTLNPSHAYAAAGTYSVTLTVTDNGGASNTSTQSVTVTSSPPNVLQNGVAVSNLSASVGSSLNYTLPVPAGATNLKFVIAGGSGDADMYVKFGAVPSDTVYDCRPYVGGNGETCSIASVQAGTYYVRVKAYAAFSGLSLTASYTAPGSNVPPTANFSSSTNGLTATFTDSSTDSDGSIASRSWNFGDGGTATTTSPSHAYAAAGTYNVALTVTDNGGASSTRTQAVSVIAPPPNVLQNGVLVSGLSASVGNSINYTMNVPAGATNLKFIIAAGSGDADLYVRFGAAPTDSVYTCRPYLSGNNETCSIASVQAGTYYVRVKAYAAYAGVSLTGSYTP
ncbi:MAG: PKD domain-containing protein [Tahibacter sp.]